MLKYTFTPLTFLTIAGNSRNSADWLSLRWAKISRFFNCFFYFKVFVGNVLSVVIMISALSATMVTSTTCDIDFIVSAHLELRGASLNHAEKVKNKLYGEFFLEPES